MRFKAFVIFSLIVYTLIFSHLAFAGDFEAEAVGSTGVKAPDDILPLYPSLAAIWLTEYGGGSQIVSAPPNHVWDMTGSSAGGYYIFLRDGSGNVLATSTLFGWDGTNLNGVLLPDSSTRILSVTPQDGSTVATSTTVGIEAYINFNDYAANTKLEIYLYSTNCSGFSGNLIDAVNNTCTKTFDFYPDSYGHISTTTAVDFSPWGGKWTYKGTITVPVNCYFGYCFSSNNLTSTTTSFTVGQPSQFDTFMASTTPVLAQLTDIDLASCNPISGHFDIARCLAVLFVPDVDHIGKLASDYKDNVFSRVPMGYAVRFVDILANAPTTTLPMYTFDIHFSSTSSSTIAFDMNDMLAGGATMLDNMQDPYHGKTFKDVAYPLVQLTVALALVTLIVVDVMGSHKKKFSTPKGST